MNQKVTWQLMVEFGLLLCFTGVALPTESSPKDDPRWAANVPGHFIIGDNGQTLWNTNVDQFWSGTWNEDTNGWRVQLRLDTNLVPGTVNASMGNPCVLVEWGSVKRHSGGGYSRSPNGKFLKYELVDSRLNIIRPRPLSETNLMRDVYYGTVVPVWPSASAGNLGDSLPEMITTNTYPQLPGGGIAGAVAFFSNGSPDRLNLLKLDDYFSITNEGDYTLVVQPVIYKRYNHTNHALLDRVDLPLVSKKLHLVPNTK